MSIAFRNVTSASDAGSSVTCADPGVAGDFLLAIWSFDRSGAGIATPPDGTWTQIFSGGFSGDGCTYAIWYKNSAVGSGNYTFTGPYVADQCVVISAWSGVDATTPLQVTPDDETHDDGRASPANVPAPTITTTVNDCRIVWVGIGDQNQTTPSATFGAPSGYTLRIGFTDVSGYNMIGVADLQQTTAGATGVATGTITRSGGGFGVGGFHIALAPAGGGSGVIVGNAAAGASASGTLTGKASLVGAAAAGATVTGTLQGPGSYANLAAGAVCTGTAIGRTSLAAGLVTGAIATGTLSDAAASGFVFVDSAVVISDASSTTMDMSSSLDVQAGDLLIIGVKVEVGGLTTVAAAKDSGSPTNTFTFDSGDDVGFASVGTPDAWTYMGYRLASTADAALTVRVTLGAAKAWKRAVVLQFRPAGGKTVSKVDSSFAAGGNASNGAPASMSSGNVTVTGNDIVAVGFYGEYSGQTLSAHAINGVADDGVVDSGAGAQAWYNFFSSGFTGAATATGSAGRQFGIGLLAFNAASGGSGAIVGSLSVGATCVGTVAARASLGGACSVSAAAVAAISGKTALVANLAAGATVAGTIGGGVSSIVGSLSAGANCSATLTGRTAILGSCAAGASVTGTLVGRWSCVGSATGSASCAGTLVGRWGCVGAAAGSASCVGTIAARGVCVGLAAAGATSSGTLVNGIGQSASLAVGAVASGTLLASGSCVGAASAGAAGSGTLVGIASRAATAAAGAVCSATVLAIGSLGAACAAGATCAGSLVGKLSAVAALAVGAACVGVLLDAGSQSAALSVGASCVATVTAIGHMSANLSAGATVVADTSNTASIAASLAAGASCSGVPSALGRIGAGLTAGASVAAGAAAVGTISATLSAGALCVGDSRTMEASCAAGATCVGVLGIVPPPATYDIRYPRVSMRGSGSGGRVGIG